MSLIFRFSLNSPFVINRFLHCALVIDQIDLNVPEFLNRVKLYF